MRKSSIHFRACKKSIQVYRLRYKHKAVKIFSVAPDLSNANQLLPSLENDQERRRYNQWLEAQNRELHKNRINAILQQGPDSVMYDIADAVDVLAQSDPNGRDPKNKRIGVEIWGAWQRIVATIAAKNAWKVQQKYALAQLKIKPNSRLREGNGTLETPSANTEADTFEK